MRDPRSDSAASIIYMLLSPFTPKFTTKPQTIRDTTQIVAQHVTHQCELFRFLLKASQLMSWLWHPFCNIILCIKRFKFLLIISLGKKRRLTLLECNNDINSMIDVAKIADLVSTRNLIIIFFFNFQPCIARFSNIIIIGCLFGVLSLLYYPDFPDTKFFVVIFISGSSADWC